MIQLLCREDGGVGSPPQFPLNQGAKRAPAASPSGDEEPASVSKQFRIPLPGLDYDRHITSTKPPSLSTYSCAYGNQRCSTSGLWRRVHRPFRVKAAPRHCCCPVFGTFGSKGTEMIAACTWLPPSAAVSKD